uniref:lipoprotein n=1 Tax=Flavobacterium sp. TaxID=239 RepID=UPI00404B0DFF
MKKIFLFLYIAAGLSSCSNDDNGIEITSSDNKVTFQGIENEFIGNGSYIHSNGSIEGVGSTYEGYYYHEMEVDGILDGVRHRLNLEFYTASASFPTGTLTYSETASGDKIISYGQFRVFSPSESVYYYVNEGSVTIEDLTGTVKRVKLNLKVTDVSETNTYDLKGRVVESFSIDN